MQHRVLSALAITGTLLFLAPFAIAQSPDAPQQKRGLGACRTEIATHCAGVEAGGGKRIDCLNAHRAKLSPECGAAVDARLAGGAKRGTRGAGANPEPGKGAGPAGPGGPPAPSAVPPQASGPSLPPINLGKSCATDLATHCQTIEKGRAKRLACLTQIRDKLSPECGVAVDAAAARRSQMRAACAADRKAHCAGQKGPEGQTCLRKNIEKLSPACARFVAATPERKRSSP